jgi:hypothetical protein
LGTQLQAKRKPDPAIESLDLAPKTKRAAYLLKRKHPSVVFTSGRRDKKGQARAMASNVANPTLKDNRHWIKKTYKESPARDALQKWVDDNGDKTTKSEIAEGLLGVLDGLTAEQLSHVSKHLTGEAFDVQPVTKHAAAIKKTIRNLPGLSWFTDKEGGLVRWHAQF